MSGWVKLFDWQKHHYFRHGRALCGRGLVPFTFRCFARPKAHRRCLHCQRAKA